MVTKESGQDQFECYSEVQEVLRYRRERSLLHATRQPSLGNEGLDPPYFPPVLVGVVLTHHLLWWLI